jgi:uncharacterized membrane protein
MRYLAPLTLVLSATVGTQWVETQSGQLRIELIEIGRTFGADVSSNAVAVNHRGVVAINLARPGRPNAAYTWSASRGLRLHVEAAAPRDINNRGHLVGTTACEESGCTQSGFVWTPTTGVQNLGDFIPEAVNEKGDMAGTCTDTSTACVRIAGRVITIAPALSIAQDINEKGVVAGALMDEATDGRWHPFVWSPSEGLRLLDDSGAEHGSANAINDSGQAVGTLTRFENERPFTAATRWRRIGRIVATHPDPTVALGVNNIGRVVGYGGTDAGVAEYAILWRLGKIIALPRGSHTNAIAFDINNSGLVAGTGFSPNQNSTALIWRIHE